jgi:hypothetical protein
MTVWLSEAQLAAAHTCAVFGRCQRRRAARTAAADHQHVDVGHRALAVSVIDECLGLQESAVRAGTVARVGLTAIWLRCRGDPGGMR